MVRHRLLTLAIASLLVPVAHASVDLIAVGTLDGASDLSAETAAPLENGAPGNLLGGLGSGLAYSPGVFLALPDRGPNAIAYNSAVSDTASYINRFHTLRLDLVRSAPGSALPFALTPRLKATTLLYSATPLVYGTGTAEGLASGAPALNATQHKQYLTGRSDNFDPFKLSTDPSDGRLDPEGIRLSPDATKVYITDEYGPYVYRFNRMTGQRDKAYALPAGFGITFLSANGDEEIAANSVGRVANKGMEGLAVSPDGHYLFGMMQSPLAQDGGTGGAYTRIIRIDTSTGATVQFAYPLTNIGTASKPKYPTVSEIVAIDSHSFLVDERDGKGLGDNSQAAYKRLYRIDLAGATDVSGFTGAASLAPYAVAKTLFLDLVVALGAHGYAPADIPAKLEGLSFGPNVLLNGAHKRTLWVSNDNDFIGTVTDSLHPGGIANPNRFFVFAVDSADLPPSQ